MIFFATQDIKAREQLFYLVFEGPVLRLEKDRDWTGPGPEKTRKNQDQTRPRPEKTAKRPVFMDQSLWLKPV